jgi:hypothetical protein
MKTKQIIQQGLNKISQVYHNEIPLSDIFGLIKSQGGIPVMEDGQEWQGFLCGKSSNATIQINGLNKIKFVHISWYMMESGRYEITSYLI